ncbi:DUF86 domain-containing protein [Candidatus Desulfarcum epimagneticum]|uniref:DUF86 domain-containing protein n=1 Tax=uncultured Desulfobacteraceae bacterium TaxID=218296 RepID=A0A484HH69_9BACT|nr:DUF86 domain-containing protein [uncultured Desulfobacteraceae bacterium]
MKDQRLVLIHIKESIEKIQQYTVDGESLFLNDPKTQDAVIRNFEIIGEAVKRLSEETRRIVSEIPWRQFAGLRDVLIHQYDGIHLSEVWLMVENDLPMLKEAVKTLLESHNIK